MKDKKLIKLLRSKPLAEIELDGGTQTFYVDRVGDGGYFYKLEGSDGWNIYPISAPKLFKTIMNTDSRVLTIL